MGRPGRVWRLLTLRGMGTALSTLAVTGTTSNSGKRPTWRGLPGMLEAAWGLPTRARLLVGCPWSIHGRMHTLPLHWIDGVLIVEPHTVWPCSRFTGSPTVVTWPQLLWPTTALWWLLVGEMRCSSYPLETLHWKRCSIFYQLHSACFSRELILSCTFWMLQTSYQLWHRLDTVMCFTPNGILVSMLLLPQLWFPSDHLPPINTGGNQQIGCSFPIVTLGLLDLKESNCWPRTQPLLLNCPLQCLRHVLHDCKGSRPDINYLSLPHRAQILIIGSTKIALDTSLVKRWEEQCIISVSEMLCHLGSYWTPSRSSLMRLAVSRGTLHNMRPWMR